jgi:hypothetical protein
MKAARHFTWILSLLSAHCMMSQETNSGIDLRATVTAQVVGSSQLADLPRSGAPVAAGARILAYPAIKFDDHLSVTSTVQLVTRPYYYADLSSKGYGATLRVLQATVNYSRVGQNGSILLRAGEMSSAFGSFVLRYDDAENALVDLPPAYGYYSPVSLSAVAGAQIDATRGKWDGRIQFANSSPSNPRSPFARDQYGNWAGGAGYTIRQGFRVGGSAYEGPYLDRSYPYFFPGEKNPGKLRAHGLGMDAAWEHGRTRVFMEADKFVLPYSVIPSFRESAGYAEVREVLSPRWFVAGRVGLTRNNIPAHTRSFETSAGFRPNRLQLLKIGYELEQYSFGSDRNANIFAIQFITTFHKSAAWE